ncbi:MAG TPA: KUP/HAK/KT family potassium transporter, partial [Steroidobacteraceae bacterium]|nr:KUP/HAK/KT family potassium transporter [Steroidobacteraceae bacterium]
MAVFAVPSATPGQLFDNSLKFVSKNYGRSGGSRKNGARLQDEVVPVDDFMANIVEGSIPRVSGTAVFLTRTQRDAPPVMVWHIKHNRALHERLFVLTVTTESVP